jgi:hypothetical protein
VKAARPRVVPAPILAAIRALGSCTFNRVFYRNRRPTWFGHWVSDLLSGQSRMPLCSMSQRSTRIGVLSRR